MNDQDSNAARCAAKPLTATFDPTVEEIMLAQPLNVLRTLEISIPTNDE